MVDCDGGQNTIDQTVIANQLETSVALILLLLTVIKNIFYRFVLLCKLPLLVKLLSFFGR